MNAKNELLNKEKLFVDYTTASRLKKFGYNEVTETMYMVHIGTGNSRDGISVEITNPFTRRNSIIPKVERSIHNSDTEEHCSRPLFVDVFEYFERKHKLSYIMTPTVDFKKIYKIVDQYVQILYVIEKPFYEENEIVNKMMDIVEQRTNKNEPTR